MKISLLFSLLSICLSVPVFAGDFQCSGSDAACAKGREIYRLERLTGETCAGGSEACIRYLQNRLDDKNFEKELAGRAPVVTSKDSKNIYCINLKSKLACLRFSKNHSQNEWMDPRNPPVGVSCYVSKDGKSAACIE